MKTLTTHIFLALVFLQNCYGAPLLVLPSNPSVVVDKLTSRGIDVSCFDVSSFLEGTNVQYGITLYEIETNNLMFLSGIPLRYLAIQGSDITDISEITNHIDLEHVTISYSPLSNIKEVAALTNLQSISIEHTNVSDLSPLSGLKNLEQINISGVRFLSLASIPTNCLRRLIVDYSTLSPADLQYIASIPNLSIAGTGWIFQKSNSGQYNCIQIEALRESRLSNRMCMPDFCVVLVDGLRPDHLGCYGYERDTSPAIDAFAEGAVRFDQAIASGSWTQPSIMSMMTSVPADVHRRVHWGRPHSTNIVTLAETLQKAGYQTVGLVANPMTNRKYGFARGFDFYDDWSLTGAPDATQGDIARQTAQGAKLTRLAQDWIERRRDPEMPLFLFVHYIDVHWDYIPPPPFNRMFAPDPIPPPRDIWNMGRKSVPEVARRRSVAAYDGEIRYTDGCISNLLAAIDASPRGKDTVVVFCSDHGESFWERGVASHGNALFDEELRVPLVIRPACGDGAPAPGRVVTQQVALIDLAPTLADLAGVPAPTNWVGRSLAPALRSETLPEIPIVLDNRIGDGGAILRGVRTSRWKVLAGPPHDRPTSLYDLLSDPAETNDLLRAGDFALPPEVEALVPLLKPAK